MNDLVAERATGPLVLAVDTGGTFTDVVALHQGSLTRLKLPSTPADPARAVLEGIARILAGSTHDTVPGEPAARPAFLLVHGSTVATNALLERKGARVALVANRGFEDVLEIGRQNRPQLYALAGFRPPPLVPAAARHGVAGRIGPDGAEIEPLDEQEIAGLQAKLAAAEAIAICLLHSYANPSHEQRIATALAELDVPISVSSELLPEYREYERTATTVLNAYVAPRIDSYLARLEAESGAGRIRIMGSNGGAVAVRRARREAAQTILSGPAGGVMGALHAAGQAGIRNIIGFDMGGTSTDVSLCPGRPPHTRDFSIAGLPVALPVIDIHTVGAGGGSLARIDAGGALRVGPESAGAEPGPICYGLGGTEVTVTDAHVWLGRLPADAFLGGERRLEAELIAPPIRALAERLGAEPDEAAEGVLAIADAAMERALRVISVERGYDPADFVLVPFGGAAGLHAAGLADRLGIPRIFLPADPGVLSAFGMLVAPVRKDLSRTIMLEQDRATPERLADLFAKLETEALEAMADEGVAADQLQVRRVVDARYRGQSFEIRVPAENWIDAFHTAHEARYGFARRNDCTEAVTLRVEAIADSPEPIAAALPAAPAEQPEPDASANVALQGSRCAVPRFDRIRLLPGHRLGGPAIITEYSATTWLPPAWQLEIEPTAGMLLTRQTAERRTQKREAR